MKKWQKIVGIIVFVTIGILLAFSMNEIEIIYIHQDLFCGDNLALWDIKPYIITLEVLSVVLYLIVLTLFILLWRKGGKNENAK